MVMWGMLVWWYADGWRQCWTRVMTRVEATLDYFSIGLLIKTLFAPFRQISAGAVRGSLEVQMRAFVDRLFSRLIGMVVRLMMIVIGGLAVLLQLVLGLILTIGWPLVPLLPIVGLILFFSGWLPWTN